MSILKILPQLLSRWGVVSCMDEGVVSYECKLSSGWGVVSSMDGGWSLIRVRLHPGKDNNLSGWGVVSCMDEGWFLIRVRFHPVKKNNSAGVWLITWREHGQYLSNEQEQWHESSAPRTLCPHWQLSPSRLHTRKLGLLVEESARVSMMAPVS